MSEPRKYYVVYSFFVLSEPKCVIFDSRIWCYRRQCNVVIGFVPLFSLLFIFSDVITLICQT